MEYYQPSFYEQHKTMIYSVTAVFILLTCLLIFVIFLNKRRRYLLNELEVERQLLESKVLIRTQDLENAKIEAEQSAKAKSEFLANMSHEIRTPMGGVIGLTNLLKQTSLSNTQRQYLDKLGYSADQLLVVINDILDFSKIESGKIELEAYPFSINTVVDYLKATFETIAKEKGVDFVISIDQSLHPDLIGDIVRINQVLINLCSNALKFTHQGQVCVNIFPAEGNARTDVYPVAFAVSDTGIGIAEAKLQSLFDAFTQADTSTTRKFGGTGLGLSISKHLCQLMQGDIKVDSELGTGSTFTAVMQLKLNDQVVLHDNKPLRFDTPKSVLIVDDNLIAIEVLQPLLLEFNLTVETASSASDAMQKIESRTIAYDVIISDWTMPVTDGETFIRHFRATRPNWHTSVIVLTAYNLDVVKTCAKELDITAMLCKPVLASVLFETLKGAISEKTVSACAKKAHPFTSLKFLVAEDNEINQLIIRELLTSEGAIVDLVGDGLQCIQAFEDKDYDIILMDIHMPTMDGVEATKNIRNHHDSSKKMIPIVALTANVMAEDIDYYLSIGMNAHVAKPIHLETLKSTIASLTLGPESESLLIN